MARQEVDELESLITADPTTLLPELLEVTTELGRLATAAHLTSLHRHRCATVARSWWPAVPTRWSGCGIWSPARKLESPICLNGPDSARNPVPLRGV